MTNKKITVTEGDRRAGRVTQSALKSGQATLSGKPDPRVAAAADREQKKSIIRDTGLDKPDSHAGWPVARGPGPLGDRSRVATRTRDLLRNGYTLSGLRSSVGGAAHKIVSAGGEGPGSDITSQTGLGGAAGTLRTRQEYKKKVQDGRLFAYDPDAAWKNKKKKSVKNEEYSQEYTEVLEQMILTITGMELGDLHEAVGNRLSEDTQTDGRMRELGKKARASIGTDYDLLGKFERRSRTVFGLGGKKLAPSSSAYFKKYPRALGLNNKRVDDL